jgi:hypothetical protein
MGHCQANGSSQRAAIKVTVPELTDSESTVHKKSPLRGFDLAGGEGLEPPLAESESAVLPLDDPPKGRGVSRS